MPDSQMSKTIADDARFLRDLKTRLNAFRKRYPTREERRVKLDALVVRASRELDTWIEGVWLVAGFDANAGQWAGQRPVLDEAESDCLFLMLLKIDTRRLHLRVFDRVCEEALQQGTDAVELGLAAWLSCRFLAPVYILAEVMIDPSVPERLRNRAILIVSGATEAMTNLAFNRRLARALFSENSNMFERLREVLPGAVLQAFVEIRNGQTDDNLFHLALTMIENEGQEKGTTTWPTDLDTGAPLEFEVDPTYDPANVLETQSDASASALRAKEFMDSLKPGEQKRLLETMLADEDLIDNNVPDTEIAERMNRKAENIRTDRQRLKKKATGRLDPTKIPRKKS